MEKFIHFHLFTCIIFSILLVVVLGNANSLSPLNSTYIKEARERFMSLDPTKLPDPPMPPYTFTIYHRDVFEKSKFKDYHSLLENKLARSHARASYLASVLESKNTQEGGIRQVIPKSTDIHYGSFEYVGSFFLGSEKIKNYLIIDTGSDLLWWQCAPCNKCYKQDQPLYDSVKSRTFRIPGCKHDSKCRIENPAYHCNPINSECTYTVGYADHGQTKGLIAEDEIIFGHWPVMVVFGCSNDQTGKKDFYSFAAGIAGLGRPVPGGYSLPSQFGGNSMSMCLPSFYSGKQSVLSFDTSKWPRATSAKLLFNYKYPTLYYVNLYKIFIDDTEFPLSPSWWEFRKDMSGGVFVDTGATFSYFPHDFYIIFRDIFRELVRDIPMVENPISPFDTCYKQDPNGRGLNFPVVKLYFGSVNSSTMLLLAKERVMLNVNGLYCLAFVGWNMEYLSILGMNQLQGVALTFDTEANTLSFDIDAC